MPIRPFLHRLASSPLLASAALAAAVVLAPLPAADAADVQATDRVIFQNGRTIEGKVLEETATEITMLVVMGTMSAEVTYPKADVLKIERNAIAVDASNDADDAETMEDTRASRDEMDDTDIGMGDATNRVYHIELSGRFGRDISQTPIRNALDDARDKNATHIIVELNNLWEGQFGDDFGDDAADFDEFSRTEAISPIFTEEIRTEWANPPQVIFWVRNAMGGAAFLPFLTDTIYFHPRGRIGGVGNLAEMFEGVGDEVVGDKQRSLRAARARGLAIHGGHDERIIKAMTERPYELWLRIDRGRPVLIDNPDDVQPNDILLTDDGEDENADSDAELVRGEGNDVLTVREDTARQLGLSKGTADSIQDILFDLGIDDDSEMIEGDSERITTRWRQSIDRAERELQRLWQDFNQVQVGGDRRDRQRGRGLQMRMLEDMETTLRRFEEAIVPQRIGVPTLAWVQDQQNIIREQMRLDRD